MSTKERALELLCTAAGDASAVRRVALAVPVRVCTIEGMSSCGHECAIGVLAAIYDGEAVGVVQGRVLCARSAQFT
uniref:Uncharacterized protein n=1 Tax=Aegilops tauschii subsp. strangulata TaxID=200361 RepID=A0A453S5Z2_AEGTS